MAPSVETLVRVLRLLKVMATVFPANARCRWGEMVPFPDLMSILCLYAFRTRVVNSVGVRSAIDSRCRGAKGDVGGAVGEEDEDE